MRAGRWIATVAVGSAFVALPGVATAAAHKCPSVTIGSDSFTHIGAHGVSCKYARTVFVPQIDSSGDPPAGWADEPPVHLANGKVKDTFVKGAKKKIAFTFAIGS